MKDSSIGRIPAVLLSPGETFASIGRRPTWVVALIVLLLCGLAAVAAQSAKVDFESSMREELANANVPIADDEIETQIAFMGKFGQAIVYAAALIMPWVVYPLIALVLFLTLRLVGGELTYKHSLSVSVYANMPWALASLLSIPIALGRDAITTQELEQGLLLPANLLAFVSSENAIVQSLLASASFFSVWTVVLLVIGFATVARVSWGRAAGVVIGWWLAWVVMRAGFAALGQLVGGG